MATFRLATNEPVPSVYVSGPFYPDMTPDRYGTLVVTHSGARLGSSSTVVVSLQGTLDDGTTWFDLETVRPSDTDYINGTTNSWCRIVPLVNRIRISVSNGGNLTYNAWIVE